MSPCSGGQIFVFVSLSCVEVELELGTELAAVLL
jgi:hypothetical protein